MFKETPDYPVDFPPTSIWAVVGHPSYWPQMGFQVKPTATQVNVLFSLEKLGDLERVCLSGPSVLRNVLAKTQVLDFRKEVQEQHEALVQESGWLFQVSFEVCSNMASRKIFELASFQCHL